MIMNIGNDQVLKNNDIVAIFSIASLEKRALPKSQSGQSLFSLENKYGELNKSLILLCNEKKSRFLVSPISAFTLRKRAELQKWTGFDAFWERTDV